MLENTSRNPSTHEKKKSQLRFNVGGGCVLGGVVLLGGGLAVAGLVAAFTIIKSKNSARDDQKNEYPAAAPEKIRGSQGLGSVLQNPTSAVHQNSCGTNHGVTESHMDSRELISARNMDLGDKSVPILDGEGEGHSRYQQEILFSDDFSKESTELSVPEIVIKDDSGENLQPIEKMEMKKEDGPAETENLRMQSEKAEEDGDGSDEHDMDKEEMNPEGEIAPKEKSTMQPVEEEEESDEEDENLPMQPVKEGGGEGDHDDNYDDKHANDDSSEEDITEKEEESSEGTGSSSWESNIEAIWPTDMIDALSHELKVMNANNQDSVVKMARTKCNYLNGKSEHGSKNETTENAPILNKKTPQGFVTVKVETIHLPMREVCVWSLLALILLLLLLHIHRTSPLQDLITDKFEQIYM